MISSVCRAFSTFDSIGDVPMGLIASAKSHLEKIKNDKNEYFMFDPSIFKVFMRTNLENRVKILNSLIDLLNKVESKPTLFLFEFQDFIYLLKCAHMGHDLSNCNIAIKRDCIVSIFKKIIKFVDTIEPYSPIPIESLNIDDNNHSPPELHDNKIDNSDNQSLSYASHNDWNCDSNSNSSAADYSSAEHSIADVKDVGGYIMSRNDFNYLADRAGIADYRGDNSNESYLISKNNFFDLLKYAGVRKV